jgi:hypothetical protein
MNVSKKMSDTIEQGSAPPIRTSPDFPPGYGDFEILSSDNIIFSFPSGVLAHVSPVFKDMFTIEYKGTPREQETLKVTEDAATIRLLLLFNDPLREPLNVMKDTAVPFLEMAMKYQVSRMLSDFKKWVVSKDGLIPHQAMMVLSLAERFTLRELGSVALSHLIKAHKDFISSKYHPISLTTSIQLLEYRMERTEWLVKKYMELIKALLFAMESNSRPPPTHISASLPPPWGQASRVASPNPPCAACHAKIHDLVGKVVIGLHSEPSWSTLDLETQRLNFECQKCRMNLWSFIGETSPHGRTPSPNIRTSWETLKQEVVDMESQNIALRSLI